MECKHHGLVIFHLYGRGSRKPTYRCKRCVGEAVTRRLRKVKQMLVDEFGGGCVICGYDRVPSSLCFHHVDPSQKSLPMTMAAGRSIDTYREEAKKCILVCANCHGEIESGVIRSPPAGAKLPTLLSMLESQES